MVPNAPIEPNGFDLYIQHLFNPPSYIPRVMLLFAFFASLFWTILKIIEIMNRKPILELRITREFFLRIFESGECFYVNAVLVAYNAGALIESVKVELKRHNGATKSFNLNVVNFGEKVRSEALTPRYYFYSNSPISFLPDSIPQRVTYLCSQEEYAESIRRAYADFVNGLLTLKEKYAPAAEEGNSEKLAAAAQETVSAMQETCSRIVESLQIEPGNHALSIKVFYRQRGRILPFYRQKQVTSSLRFSVEPNVRDVLKAQIRQYVEGLARNIIFGRHDFLPAPDYIPVNINEET